jgi:excisionase family DNA binding protein
MKQTDRLNDLPDILTVPEVMKLLRIGRNTTYEAIRSGALPSIRIGRRILVPKKALELFLLEGPVVQPGTAGR